VQAPRTTMPVRKNRGRGYNRKAWGK
jgi:hypothetical protein